MFTVVILIAVCVITTTTITATTVIAFIALVIVIVNSVVVFCCRQPLKQHGRGGLEAGAEAGVMKQTNSAFKLHLVAVPRKAVSANTGNSASSLHAC